MIIKSEYLASPETPGSRTYRGKRLGIITGSLEVSLRIAISWRVAFCERVTELEPEITLLSD